MAATFVDDSLMATPPNFLSNYAPYGLDMDLFRTMYPQLFQQYQEFQQRQQPQAVLGGGRPFFWGLPQVTQPNDQTAQPIPGLGFDFSQTPVNPVNDPPLTPPAAPEPVVAGPRSPTEDWRLVRPRGMSVNEWVHSPRAFKEAKGEWRPKGAAYSPSKRR